MRLSLLVLAAGLLALGLGLPPGAAAQAPAESTKLRVDEPSRTAKRGQLALSATLSGPDRKALADREIDFYLRTEFFGPRDAHLGTGITDATGSAILIYEPALRGRQTILARAAARGNLPAAEGSLAIEVRDAIETFHEEPLGLAAIRDWLPLGLGLVVAIVWAILLGVLLRAALEIRAVGRRARAAGSAAEAPVAAPQLAPEHQPLGGVQWPF